MNDRVLIGLVVVAVGASVLMLATGSIPVLKIALLASLWAALVGAFMVARLRQKVGDLEAQHSETDTLAEIRAQLDAMAEQLEDLSGRMIPSQPTLRAEAMRVTELPAPARVHESADDHEFAAATAETPDAETLVSSASPVDFGEEPAAEAIVEPEAEPVVEPVVEPIVESEREESSDVVQQNTSKPSSAGTQKPDFGAGFETEEEPEHTGRRRADEHSNGVSVAELLARHRK